MLFKRSPKKELFKRLEKYLAENCTVYKPKPKYNSCAKIGYGSAEAECEKEMCCAVPMAAEPVMLKKRSLSEVVGQVGLTFQQRLFQLIDEKGMTNAQVYKKANIDRKLFSKIQCNKDYCPKKKTAAALAIALELNLDETKDLLGRAGLALSPSSVFDIIIEFFIENAVYDIYTINEALYEHDQPLLGV